VRKSIIISCLFVTLAFASFSACNSDNTTDAGDATTEPPPDLCDLNTFSGNGNACPNASVRVCFPVCDAGGGCVCTKSASGPIWVCTNPPECQPCNSSPVVDAECPDANEAGIPEASTDATDDTVNDVAVNDAASE